LDEEDRLIMATIREQIISLAMSSLSASGAPAGLTVHRERTRAIESDSLPALMVYFEDDVPTTIGSKVAAPLTERVITVAVECRAQGSLTVSPDQALDPLIEWVIYQFFLDERFGGLANEVVEGKTSWSSKEGDQPLASATIHLSIKYRTKRTDPSLKG
jgi:hypothetical protein